MDNHYQEFEDIVEMLKKSIAGRITYNNNIHPSISWRAMKSGESVLLALFFVDQK